ncbi:DUF2510 domain-containing protein [Nonomuraea sp. NPDC050786]|uniref:DUF2510 domain-containing protein n=1 Tax=Nonomuraea sp. NPDC050786 TaxID=3154840 RepID=UPI0033C330B1
MTQTPAGWYPDPYGEPQLRWWDGNQWTDAVHAQQPGPGPQPGSGPQPQPQQPGSAPQFQQPGTGPQFQAQPQQPGSGPQFQAQPQQPGSGPQPQSGPDWSASPANPTLQYGQPTFGQSAYGQPAPTAQWPGGPLPGPGYGPPPKQSNPLPWVFGGLAALVVVALVVVAGIFFVNRSSTNTASPTPEDTFEQQPPPSNELPSSPPPSQGAIELPQPVGGRITDKQAGLSFEVPKDWTVPPANEVTGTDPTQQTWSGAVQATAQEKYDGQGDWVGNVYTGLLNELYPYTGASGLGETAKAVFVDFSTRYYQLAHETKVVQDKAIKIGDKDAWVLQFELDFTKISDEKGYKWKKENGAIVLMDRGQGERPAIVYASVPDNLGTDVLGKVLSSLKPA